MPVDLLQALKQPISEVLWPSVFLKNPLNCTHEKRVEVESMGQAQGKLINKAFLSVTVTMNETLTRDSDDMDLED